MKAKPNIPRPHLRPQRAATTLLTLALASGGLTACGTSSDPPSTRRSPSAQEAVAFARQRHRGVMELVRCASRHGIHLPKPTSAGVNVAGVKDRHGAQIVSACYQQALKKAELRARAEVQAEQAKQQAGAAVSGESSPSG